MESPRKRFRPLTIPSLGSAAARSRLLSSLAPVTVALVIAALASGGAAAAAGNAHSRVSISTILGAGDGVSGVRGTANGKVILTGGAPGEGGLKTSPFLFRGRLNRAADGRAVSVLTPPFAGLTTATLYGPDTHAFNPGAIPAGQVRAVGTYQSSSSGLGVLNRGMIYLGPVSGRGGSWTTIDVPAHGQATVGEARACPKARPECFVADTIPHSTMGDLVVGNYDVDRRGSGNAFIYNLTTHRWTLLRLGGSHSSKTTLYGIWQDGGRGSHVYTVAGGSSAHGSSSRGSQRGFLMRYNERTGVLGKPRYYSYGNDPSAVTHFEGITAVPGGFTLVAESSAEAASMAFVPAPGHHGPFGRATWYPVDVAASPLCAGGCSAVSGDTVYENRVMGIYSQTGSGTIHTYLARVARG